MEEAFFPRGKQEAVSSLKRKRNNNSSDDLFKESDSGKRRRKSKKLRENENVSNKTETTLEINEFSLTQIDYNSISEELLLLGMITKVLEFKLIISLPNAMLGHVSATDISDVYSKQLRQFSQENRQECEPPSRLRDMFRVGNYVICKVKEIVRIPNIKKSIINLTINPSDLYRDVFSSVQQNNMLMMAAVSSVEEHGYIMDLGVTGISGFLSKKLVPGNQLLNGQVILCSPVTTGKHPATNVRVLNLTALPKNISTATLAKDIVPSLELLPGTLLPFKVIKATGKGILGKFLKRKIVVHCQNFAESFSTLKSYKVDKTLKGRILYTHPITKAIHVTLQPNHLRLKRGILFGGLRLGDFIDHAIVESINGTKIRFKINEFCKGILTKKDSGCDSLEEMREKFKISSVHRCRVSKLLKMDNLVLLSTNPNFFKKRILNLEDVKVGDVLKGTVSEIQSNGIAVILEGNKRGFIPLKYAKENFDDVLEKKFKKDQKLNCRVLEINIEKRSIILTCRSSMLSTRLPIITSYDAVHPGLTTLGCIFKVTSNGYLISFYNDVMGFCSSTSHSLLMKEKSFQPGDLVECTVEHCNPEKNQISLLINVSDDSKKLTDQNLEHFGIGKIVSGKVIEKNKNGLLLELVHNGIKAFLPTQHLSDHTVNQKWLLRLYQVDDIIDEVLCFSRDPIPIVSLRRIFINWIKENDLLLSTENLKIGMVMPLIIKDVRKYGLFVKGLGNISGFVHISKINGKYILNIEDLPLESNKTIMGKIMEIENNKVDFSMTLEDCLLPNDSTSIEHLNSFLAEQEFIKNRIYNESKSKKKLFKKLIGDENKFKEIFSLKYGSIIEFIANEKTEEGFTGWWKENPVIKCILKDSNIGKVAITEGQSLAAAVLSIDIDDHTIYLTTNEVHIKYLPNLMESNMEIPSGTTIYVQPFFVNSNFIMGLFDWNEHKYTAFVPPKCHVNDIENLTPLAMEKHIYVEILRNCDGFVIAKRTKPNDLSKKNKKIKKVRPKIITKTSISKKKKQKLIKRVSTD